MVPVERGLVSRPSVDVAPRLLGLVLVSADGRAGRIVEVEAYGGPDDPASHAYRGPSARNATMFGPPGHLYVYFSYGVHWCANVVCAPAGRPSAVLLRALEPLGGLDRMRQARWTTQRSRLDRDLCRGPGRLCQAMSIDGSHDGTDLLGGGSLELSEGAPAGEVAFGPRIGISVAKERTWRFWLPDNPYVSGQSRRFEGLMHV